MSVIVCVLAYVSASQFNWTQFDIDYNDECRTETIRAYIGRSVVRTGVWRAGLAGSAGWAVWKRCARHSMSARNGYYGAFLHPTLPVAVFDDANAVHTRS